MQKKILLQIFFLSLLVKIAASFFLPVFGDESYYWFWGQNLQLSYFDHPPFVAWMTAFSELFWFLPYWLALRLPFILLSSASFLIWVKCLKIDSADSKSFLILFSLFYFLNPLLGLGGLLATPDVPLIFFWALSYWALQNALITQQKKHYALLGVFLGLGFCSKYHIVLFPVSALVSLAFTKQIQLVRWKNILLTVLCGLLFSLPVVIWNYQNDWISFKFQLSHGFESKTYSPLWTINYILGQIFLFNPFLLSLVWKQTRDRLSRNLALTQWLFFLYSALKANVEANWPIASQAQGLVSLHLKNSKVVRLAMGYWFMIWLSFVIFLVSPAGQEKLLSLPNSSQAMELIEQTSDFKPLYGPSYQMASLMTYISGQQIPKLQSLGRYDFYDTLDISKPKDDPFYVLKYDLTYWPQWLKDYKIESVKQIEDYKIQLYKVSRE